MKTKLFAALLGLAVVITGCVSTVSGKKTAGVPWGKDKIEARYERPLDQVYQAAVDVIRFKGTVVNESILHGQTNAVDNIVRTIEGTVDQRTVWIRMEQVDKVTAVAVQARSPGGGGDIDLAAMIDKQIALKLVR
jgi:PBP1b-binding outer membrane lipoprotein LpoB